MNNTDIFFPELNRDGPCFSSYREELGVEKNPRDIEFIIDVHKPEYLEPMLDNINRILTQVWDVHAEEYKGELPEVFKNQDDCGWGKKTYPVRPTLVQINLNKMHTYGELCVAGNLCRIWQESYPIWENPKLGLQKHIETEKEWFDILKAVPHNMKLMGLSKYNCYYINHLSLCMIHRDQTSFTEMQKCLEKGQYQFGYAWGAYQPVKKKVAVAA